ncbi:MAG: acyltransferase [Gammaproteobacteria bacterium]|nr:MAG: acyltransferase [Gammaproteobacteria bacterium]
MTRLETLAQSHDNNFSLIRVSAAYFVLLAHSFGLLVGSQAPRVYPVMFTIGEMAVNLFFAISGFLITQSYVRQGHLMRFMRARMFRLMPALIAAVLLGALVIGPLMTTLPLWDYFRHEEVWRYISKNILLTKTMYYLPGVFESNPYDPPAVNGSLWTLRYELKMYAIAALIGCVGALRHRWKFYVFATAFLAWYFAVFFRPEWFAGEITAKDEFVRIVIYFFWGAFFQMHARWIPMDWHSGLLVGLALSVVAWLAHGSHFYEFFLSAAATFWLLYAAYVPTGWIRRYNRFGDFSYGTYVYAFPVQQTWIAVFPAITPLGVLALSVPTVAAMAYASWHWLEKPALDYNKHLLKREQKTGR